MNRIHRLVSNMLAAVWLFVFTGIGCAEAKTEESSASGPGAVRHLEKTEQFAEWTATGTVLVDFYADWCGPCRAMSPALSEMAAELKDRLTVLKVNVDNHPELAQEYRVSSIPYLVLFRDGKVVDGRVGRQSAEQLRSWLTSE